MACWHASARMLAAWKQATIDPLNSKYEADSGITAAEFIKLATAAGLRTIPKVNQSYDWRFLDELLTKYGPVWAAGDWNGAPHIIGVTGVDSTGLLIVNDPAFSSPQSRNMGWFNEHIDTTVDIPMMYLP